MSGSQGSDQAPAGALGPLKEQGLKSGELPGTLIGITRFWTPLGQ